MISRWTFGRRLAAGFGVACLIMLFIGVASYRNTTELVDTEYWVNHTYQVRARLFELAAALTTAETEERGFLLTGSETFLDPYKVAVAGVKTAFDESRRLTADNPRQQARLTQLAPLIEQRLAALRDAIEARRSGGVDAAIRSVQQNGAIAVMEKVTSLVSDAAQEEGDLLQRRNDDARIATDTTTAMIRWGGLAGIVLVIVIGSGITNSLRRQIGSAVGHVESSSAELQAAANQQVSSATEQSTAMNEISTTINELLVSSRQIADSAQRVATSAEQTAQAARGGQGMVDQTSESIGGIRRQMDQIVVHMLELGKKSQEIGAVLDIVSELAEQTNILAINATIEAAGAGENGKRFAVVADEIRKLADRVGGSAKEIRTLIDEVRGAVNTTVMATETGSKAVDTGSRSFLDLSSSFGQIAGLVGSTTEAAREIGLSTKQQTSAVDQVTVAIADVAQAARETETSANQTLQTASQLSGLARDLMRIVSPGGAG